MLLYLTFRYAVTDSMAPTPPAALAKGPALRPVRLPGTAWVHDRRNYILDDHPSYALAARFAEAGPATRSTSASPEQDGDSAGWQGSLFG